jgi:hypothetical protein
MSGSSARRQHSLLRATRAIPRRQTGSDVRLAVLTYIKSQRGLQPQLEVFKMNDKQRDALRKLAQRFSVKLVESDFEPAFDLPTGYVAGWIRNPASGIGIYCGCSPEGEISS